MTLNKPYFRATINHRDRSRPIIDLVSGSSVPVDLQYYVRERLERFFVGLPCNEETKGYLQPFLENLLTELVTNGMLIPVETYEGTHWIFKEKE